MDRDIAPVVAACRRTVAGRWLGGAGARFGRCGRRRRVFDPLWRRIAAAVAVVAVAVLIGETVVNREAVDGARMPEMIAEELPTPDGNLLYNKVCPRRGGRVRSRSLWLRQRWHSGRRR